MMCTKDRWHCDKQVITKTLVGKHVAGLDLSQTAKLTSL